MSDSPGQTSVGGIEADRAQWPVSNPLRANEAALQAGTGLLAEWSDY